MYPGNPDLTRSTVSSTQCCFQLGARVQSSCYFEVWLSYGQEHAKPYAGITATALVCHVPNNGPGPHRKMSLSANSTLRECRRDQTLVGPSCIMQQLGVERGHVVVRFCQCICPLEITCLAPRLDTRTFRRATQCLQLAPGAPVQKPYTHTPWKLRYQRPTPTILVVCFPTPTPTSLLKHEQNTRFQLISLRPAFLKQMTSARRGGCATRQTPGRQRLCPSVSPRRRHHCRRLPPAPARCTAPLDCRGCAPGWAARGCGWGQGCC